MHDQLSHFVEFANTHSLCAFVYRSRIHVPGMTWKAELTADDNSNASAWADNVDDACRVVIERFEAGKFDSAPTFEPTEPAPGGDEYKPDAIHGDPAEDDSDRWPTSVGVEDDPDDDLEPDTARDW